MNKGHFIDGKWIAGSGSNMTAIDPASAEIVWQGKEATPAEVNAAVESARRAGEVWARLRVQQRVEFLQRFGEQLKSKRNEFTETICRSTGKPRWEAFTETDAMINKIAASIDAHNQRKQTVTQIIGPSHGVTRFRPHGVLAVLGPFNFPGHLPNGHIIPALLEGNTIVFKPSELAPLVAEATIELWNAAALPVGVLNLVQGARKTGEALVGHAGIDGVLFTGSFDAGRAINRQLADQPGKIVALEMGGNNPLVVADPINVDAAAYWTIQSTYLTAGQRCSCARRLILVENDSTREFLARLIAMIRNISIGPFTNQPEPFMGPVISDSAADRLLAAQQDLIKRGGKSLIEMRPLPPRRAMLSPGLIDVTAIKNRDDTEHFGPLLQVIRVNDFESAIEEANRTKFGLTAGLLCESRERWEQFLGGVRAGVVNWNRALTGASAQLPFGGLGCSGNHRPSAFFAADYCSSPVASLENEELILPPQLAPGLSIPK